MNEPNKILPTETLLDMSKRQYRTATLLYKEYPSDDGIINDGGYPGNPDSKR